MSLQLLTLKYYNNTKMAVPDAHELCCQCSSPPGGAWPGTETNKPRGVSFSCGWRMQDHHSSCQHLWLSAFHMPQKGSRTGRWDHASMGVMCCWVS